MSPYRITLDPSPELHGKIEHLAAQNGMSMGDFVAKGLSLYVALAERQAEVSGMGGRVLIEAKIQMPDGTLEGVEIFKQ